jgi:hypothetical protein
VEREENMVGFGKQGVGARRRGGKGAGWLGCALGGLFWSCGTNNTYFQQFVIDEPDAGHAPAAPEEPGGAEPTGAEPTGLGERPPLTPGGPTPLGGDGKVEEPPPLASGAPPADVEPGALGLNVFGAVGNHYYFEASEEQVERMNAPYTGIGYGDFYTPQGGSGSVTYVDHLFVTSAGEGAHTADFGKVPGGRRRGHGPSPRCRTSSWTRTSSSMATTSAG